MQLIDNVEKFWKFASVQFTAVAAAIMTFATAFPDAALNAYLMLPAEFRTFLPPDALKWIVVVMLVLSILARLIKQPKLAAPKDGTTALGFLLVLGIGAYIATLSISAVSLA